MNDNRKEGNNQPPIRLVTAAEVELQRQYSLCHNEVLAGVPGSRERLADIKQRLNAIGVRST